jgi:uncharacterized membrane protein YbhN (UPF0104 family)
MTKKRVAILIVVVAVLGLLVYLQIRTWKRFDWEKFKDGTEGVNYWRLLAAVALIYLADFLRAVRWKIFLRPTKPNANWKGLISPQYVGFTGLALLGRPGEFIRPYLIARRENLSFPSQIAIWFVERAFDFGAVTVILSIDIFLVPSMRDNYPQWQVAGYGLIAMFLAFVAILWALWRHGPVIAGWACRRLSTFSQSFADRLENKLRAVAAGLHTIRDMGSFLQLVGISLCIWMMVALAYREVTHSYPSETGLPALDLPEVILLMGASVAGGVVQLPVVGGGSQLATIAILSAPYPRGFGYQESPELAVSCGMLLWLVSFMSVIPLGLVLAHREHVSLRRLSEESHATAVELAGNSSPPDKIRK